MGLHRLYLASFLIITLLLGADIVDDLAHGADIRHVGVEFLAFSVCFILLGEQFLRLAQSWSEQREGLKTEIAELTKQKEEWRKKTKEQVKDLSRLIDEQFDLWGLTGAEKEVGLLILKGLSHKEIAEIRNSGERTVRQQAAAIYSKAGISGKGHLAAFFLEDLMVPGQL